MSKTPGYPLPEEIDPAGRLYVCVPIPDDPAHVRAFLGQLDMLSYWWTWARDPAKTGTEVAKVWRGVVSIVRDSLDNALGCEGGMSGIYDIQLDGCNVDVKRSPAGSWETLTGQLCPGPQGATGEQGEPGDSSMSFLDPGDPVDEPGSDFRCAVANTMADVLIDRYLAMLDVVEIGGAIVGVVAGIIALFGPFGIAFSALLLLVPAVNTLTVAALRAAAEDSDFREDLRCIFYCTGMPDTGVIDQGLVDTFIAEVRNLAWVCAGTFADFMTAIRLHEFRTMVLQASGQTATDCISCGCDIWCYNYDFTANNGGWVSAPANRATWYSGSGWGRYGSTGHYVQIQSPLFPGGARELHSITIHVTGTIPGGLTQQISWPIYTGPGGLTLYDRGSGVYSVDTADLVGLSIDRFWVNFDANAVMPADFRVNSIEICGYGDDPFT